MGNAYHEPTVDPADPRRVADVVLAAAVRAQADAIYLEPSLTLGDLVDDGYLVTFERASTPIGSTNLSTNLGAAVIARLAFLAQLDLASTTASSGVVPVTAGGREADVVITVRPGASLRADVMVMLRKRAATAPTMSGQVMAGDIVGNYKILERLGEGGMGTVYSVEHVALGRRYALKVLRKKVVEREPSAAQRFLREARAAARIRHANIVDVFDFGHVPDGRPYFVMELLEGESLGERVERGALPIGDVVTIARQLALGLAAAHDCGVVHADVTPSNALVLASGDAEPLHVKLLDFGLAELAGEAVLAEESDFVLGTPAYISPEQLRGLAPTDRSDQYGLGAVLYQLTVGHPPFEDNDLRALCMKHIQAPIPPVTSPHGPLPGKLADVITTCLQKAPGARFPGMRAMIAALDEIERVVDRRGWRKWLSS